MITCTGPSPLIEVRRARLEDYEGVLDINKYVYLGLDYIPFHYKELVTDPDFSFYVCLVNGEVGAFEGVCLLDDNKSLMTRAARVKDKFQGQGLLAHIKKKIYEDYKDIPGEKRLRCACTNLVRYVHSARFLSLNKTLLVETITMCSVVDVRQMTPVSANVAEASPISWDQFSTLLQCDPVRKYLFPDNIITAMSWFYDALPSNLPMIKKMSSQVLITKHLYNCLPELENNQVEAINESANNSDEGENCEDINCTHGLLGIISHYFSPTSLLFVINLFGQAKEGKEIEEITPLLKHGLAFMQSLCLDKPKIVPAVFCFSHNEQIPSEILHEVAKPFGVLQSTTEEPTFTRQYYFEQDFDYLLK